MDPQVLYLRNGEQIPLPPGIPQEFVEELYAEYPDVLLPPPTVGGAVAEGLMNIPRGALGMGLSAARGITALLPGDTGMADRIAGLQERLYEGTDPRYQESTIAQIGLGLGSIAPIAASVVAGPAAPFILGGLSGAGEQAERMDAAEEAGMDVGPVQRGLATAAGTAIGLTEALPVGRVMGRVLPRAVQEGAERAVARAAQTAARARLPRGRAAQALGSAFATGVAEGAQEMGAAFGQNLVGRTLYDPTQEVMPGTQEGIVGFGAGAVFDLLMQGVGGRYGRLGNPGRTLVEDERRRQEQISSIREEIKQTQDDVVAAQEEGREIDPVTDYPTSFDVREVAPGQFAVVDESTGEPVIEGVSESAANGAKAKIAASNARRAAIAATLSRLRFLGLSNDPDAVEAAVLATLPENNSLPLTTVANYITEDGASRGVRIDPRDREARTQLSRGLLPEEKVEVSARRAELEGNIADAARRAQEALEGAERTRAQPTKLGRIVPAGAGAATVETDLGSYTLTRKGRGQWELMMPGAVFSYGTYRTREAARKAIRDHEREVRRKAAAEAREAEQARAERRARRIEAEAGESRRALEALEKELERRGVGGPDQEKFDALATLRAQGQVFLPMSDARQILGEEQFQRLLEDRAGIAATTLAEMNRDVVENLNTKTGLPILRKRTTEGRALIEEGRDRFLTKMGVADFRRTEEGTLDVSTKNILDLLRDKGWSISGGGTDAGLVSMARVLTGYGDIRSIADLNQPARAYLYTQLAALPTLEGKALGKLPDISPRRYTAEQYERVRQEIARRDGGEKRRLRQILREQTGISNEVLDQIMADLGVRGVISEAGSQIAYKGEPAPAVREIDRAPAALERLRRALAGPDGTVTPEMEVVARDIQAVLDERNAAVRKAAEEAGAQDPAAVDQAQKEAEDFAVEGVSRVTDAEQALEERIEKQLGFKVSEDGKRRLRVHVVRDMAAHMAALGHVLTGKDPSGAYVDVSTGGPGHIILNAAHVDPEGTLSTEELVKRLEPTLFYEAARFMRDNDMFTAGEWRALASAARRLRNPEGLTYEDVASRGVPDPNAPGAREEVRERAIAEMIRDARIGRLKIADPVPKGIIRRAVRFVSDMVGATRASRVAPALSAINRFMGGEVGKRKMGKTPFSPEGPVRTGLYQARDIGPPTPASRPLSDEEVAALTARRDADIRADAKAGRIPRVGKNASPEALNVYYGPQRSGEGHAPAVRFRLSRARETPDPFGGAYKDVTLYKPPNKTPFESLLDALWSHDVEEGMSRDGEDFFRRLRQSARSNFLNGRNEILMLDEMVRQRGLEEDPEGLTLLADQEAGAAIHWADQLMHFMSQAMALGKMRYVSDVKIEDGRVASIEGSTDPGRGFWFVEEAPLVTKSGKEFRNFIEVMALLQREDGTNGENIADNYVTRKRAIQLSKRADLAEEALAQGGLSRSEVAELEKIIQAGRIFPGGITAEEAVEYTQRVEADPSLRWVVDFSEGQQAWNDTLLDLLRDSGVISEFTANLWKGSMYVPFQKGHERDNLVARLKKKRDRKQSANRRASIEPELMGSIAPLDIPLLERIVSNTEGIIHDAMMNVAHYRTAQRLKELGVGYDISRGDVDSTVGLVKYYEGGQEKFVQIDPHWTQRDHVIAALNAGGEDLFEGAFRALPFMANVLRQAVTRTPDFIIRNLMRDTNSVFVTSQAGFRPVIDTFKKFLPTTEGDASYLLARQLGLSLETDNVNDVNRYRSQIKRAQRKYAKHGDEDTPNLILRAWDALGEVSKRSDTATRMAVFDDVYQRTGNLAEAQFQALEVINFGRRGRSPVFRLITAAVPFMNARVQGLDLIYRSAMGKYTSNRVTEEGRMANARDIRDGFLTRGLLLTAITGAYYALVGDEEWYKNQRDEIKDDYWILPGPSGTIAKIPVPFEVGLLFKTIPEQIARNLWEEGYASRQHVDDLRRAVLQTANINPMPQIAKPIWEAVVNYNSFTGERIVPEYMEEGLPPLDRKNLSTPESASMIAALANSVGIRVDPLRVEYVVNGYMGAMGGYVLALADVLARQEPVRSVFNALPWVDELPSLATPTTAGTRSDLAMWRRNTPFLRSVIGDAAQGGGYQQRFYELRNRVNQVVAGLNKARAEGRIEDYRAERHENAAIGDVRATVRRLDRYMARWRERRDALLRSDLDPDLIRERLRMMEQERDEQLAIVPFLSDIAEGRAERGG